MRLGLLVSQQASSASLYHANTCEALCQPPSASNPPTHYYDPHILAHHCSTEWVADWRMCVFMCLTCLSMWADFVKWFCACVHLCRECTRPTSAVRTRAAAPLPFSQDQWPGHVAQSEFGPEVDAFSSVVFLWLFWRSLCGVDCWWTYVIGCAGAMGVVVSARVFGWMVCVTRPHDPGFHSRTLNCQQTAIHSRSESMGIIL